MHISFSKERWKPIPNYERYFVSSCGRLWDSKNKRIMKQTTTDNGYSCVRLERFDRTERKTLKTHRVVMLAFVGADSRQVNHKDLNKINNHITNLEYVSCQENVTHYILNSSKKLVSSDCYLCIS